MRRVQLDDLEAATHYFMEWRDKINIAEGAYRQFSYTDLHMDGVEFRGIKQTEARNDRVRAEDILLRRYELSASISHLITAEAEEAAKRRHTLRRAIVLEAFKTLDLRYGERRAAEIMIFGRDYVSGT